MSKRVSVFYAFPNQSPSLVEVIETAAARVNKSRKAKIKTWTRLAIGGKWVLDEITKAIDRADLFACDLTFLNSNVVFELGYAIGRLKPIRVSLDLSIAEARDNYERVHPTLVPIGFTGYVNSEELTSTFVNSDLSKDLQHLLGEGFRLYAPTSPNPSLLYLKAPLPTEASVTLSTVLENSYFSSTLVVDDPRDNPSATLLWYAEKLSETDVVLAHLQGVDQVDADHHNAKCSFVCGMALGFGKRVLMLAHEPFVSPVDYRHLLETHPTAAQCQLIAQRWLGSIEPDLPRRGRRLGAAARADLPDSGLRAVSIGDYIAEHEIVRLDDYFYPTSAFYDALNSHKTIFVGRRGTGKTANFYALQTAIGRRRHNHVCAIKPVGYDVDGIIRVLREDLHKAERGYLVQSLWKYLIYSELARSVLHKIELRPPHIEPTKDEQRFLEYADQHREVLGPLFAVRLRNVIDGLRELGRLPSARDQQLRISEKLHERLIPKLRNLLGLVLAASPKVAVLVDNLDEPWVPGQHVEEFASLVLGLLRVSSDITDDFNAADRLGKPVNLSVTVFLRSDIFHHVQRYAPEQDKLPVQRIVWQDRETLLRMLTNRLANALGVNAEDDAIWEQLFGKDVGGTPVRDFILSTVIWRPRDVIYLVKEALADAVNRGHRIVLEEDWYSARRKYSEFVTGLSIGEDDPQRRKLKDVLFAFSRAEPVLSRSQVGERIRRVAATEEEVAYYFDLLCDVSFLGIETPEGYRYARDEDQRDLLVRAARSAALWNGTEECYQINVAFFDVLQIR